MEKVRVWIILIKSEALIPRQGIHYFHKDGDPGGNRTTAKCASDATTLEHARSLLAHADSKLTERVYRRKPEHVRPLK